MDKASMSRALKFILNSDCLDLRINPSTNNYGLRFYTLFNRIEAIKKMPKLIVNQGLVELTANIITPVGYPSRFNNLNTKTIIPVTEITAIALVVKPEKLDKFLEELIKLYEHLPYPCQSPTNSNREIVKYLIYNKETKIYNFGIDAIDRSNNPAKGELIVGDPDLIWLQGTDTNVPPTFYVILMDKIPFICPVF